MGPLLPLEVCCLDFVLNAVSDQITVFEDLSFLFDLPSI